MREFISNFSIDNGVCFSVVKEIKIEFNSLMLGEWFGVPTVGFDTYYVGSKIVFSRINEKTVLKFLGINEKKGRISHNSLSLLHKLLYNIARRFILPCNSKCSEVNLRDATLIYCLANLIKINFPSLMISHLSLTMHLKLNDKGILKDAIVTPGPLGQLVTTHGDCRLAPKTNTSLSSALWPHSYAPGNTSQEVTHTKIAPHQARLTVKFLANGLPRKEDAP